MYSAAYSPDGKHVASGSLDETVKIWGAQTGEEAPLAQMSLAPARELADGAWGALEKLARCAEQVHDARRGDGGAVGGASSASILAEVARFAGLREELDAAAALAPGALDAADALRDACSRAEAEVESSRGEAVKTQREVRQKAQARATGELQSKVQQRDSQRAQHSRGLLGSLCKLLGAGEAAVRAIADGAAVEAIAGGASVADAVQRREAGAVERAKSAAAAWAAAAKDSEKAIERALEAAELCMAEYAAKHGGRKAIGGAAGGPRSPAAGGGVGPDAVAAAALRAYGDWAARVGADRAAAATDREVEALREVGSGSFGAMFAGGAAGGAREAVREALQRAGVALQAELEAQSKDFLSEMPSAALVSAGRQLLERRMSVTVALRRVASVVSTIADELVHVQQCLGGGSLFNHKEKVVAELQRTCNEVENALIDRDEIQLQMRRLRARGAAQEEQGALATESARRGEALRAARGEKSRMLARWAAVEADFPEVMVHIKEQGVPRELLRVWRDDWALSDMFAVRKRLPGAGRHAVWCCSDGKGGPEFAVKEFRLDRDLGTCLREAALLLRVQHPGVVTLVAVFQDTTKGTIMIMMPYYPHGQVDRWVQDASPRPDWLAVRGVLFDVTEGLAHLHANKVVHADVKPANILVAQNGHGVRGKLADFDIAIDSGTRTTFAFLSVSRPAGGTRGFEAPELNAPGSVCTPASDMFALGVTVRELSAACTDAKRAESAGEVGALVEALTATNAGTRPSAAAAAAAERGAPRAFFGPLLEARPEELLECCCCFEDAVRRADGATCTEGHFMCTECLQQWVRDSVGKSLSERREHEGRVRCTADVRDNACGAPFSGSDLGKVLPAKLFHTYLEKREDVLRAQLREEFEVEAEKRRKATLKEEKKMNEELTRRELLQEYPNAVQCPRCGAGPVVPENCYNLETHHGQELQGGGRVSNACPACGFFDRDRGNWARWDGRLRGGGAA